MALEETISQMTSENQLGIAIDLLESTLPIWNEFITSNHMTYTEHVVGTTQNISKTLIPDIIEAVKNEVSYSIVPTWLGGKKSIRSLHREILEPKTAIEDDDWMVTDSCRLLIFAAYNLLEHITGSENTFFDESFIYVSVNQSCDALLQTKTLTVDQINVKLKSFQ